MFTLHCLTSFFISSSDCSSAVGSTQVCKQRSSNPADAASAQPLRSSVWRRARSGKWDHVRMVSGDEMTLSWSHWETVARRDAAVTHGL